MGWAVRGTAVGHRAEIWLVQQGVPSSSCKGPLRALNVGQGRGV